MLRTPLLFRFACKGVEIDSQRCSLVHHGASAGVLDLLVSHACSKLSQVQCPTAQVLTKCALGNTKQCWLVWLEMAVSNPYFCTMLLSSELDELLTTNLYSITFQPVYKQIDAWIKRFVHFFHFPPSVPSGMCWRKVTWRNKQVTSELGWAESISRNIFKVSMALGL